MLKHQINIVFVLAIFATTCAASTRDLKEDTAPVVVIGPFVDASGSAVTPTVSGIDIRAYKNDGTTAVTITPAASGTSNDMVHKEDGYFSLELTATDTSTPGYLRLTFQISGALIFHEDFNILPANIYDSKYSSDKLEVDVAQFGGNNGTFASGRPEVNVTYISGDSTAADNAESFFDGTGYGPLLLRSAITTVTSQTRLTLNATNLTDALIGSRIIIRRPSTGMAFTGVVTSTQTGEEILFTVDGTAPFNIAGTDIVEIPPAAFGRSDRTEAAAIKAKTDSLTFTVANEVNANTRYWTGGLIPTQNVTGVPEVDITKVLGADATAVSGAIDVNVVKLIGNEIELTPP